MFKQILLTPLQKFIKVESFSGVLLFGATIIALIWVNSPFGNYYNELWQIKLGFSFHDFELRKPLILWVNDGLMAIFFFLIGLELKRELLIGEINTIKKASFPLIAALGGVLVPIAVYLMLNQNPETLKGWGIPMATDIAFALAILSLLGNRVPLSLKIFLTAFAIIDDIAAVLVIAIFYSTSIKWLLIIYALLLILFLGFLTIKGKYSKELSVPVAIIVWLLFLKSGIHPTIAGVLLAFTIPIRQKVNFGLFSNLLSSISNKIIGEKSFQKERILSKDQLVQIENLEELTEKVRSPLQYLEHQLHNWSAYFILPVFALANAGVAISTDTNFDKTLLFNIAISLFVGKFLGVALASYLGVKLKITELPSGVNFKHILGVAAIAGVGFTMSIFIDNLAFAGDTLRIDTIKIGIILGSLISGIVGFIILKTVSKSDNG
jgi:NhaA family Na+:H+ antiporter